MHRRVALAFLLLLPAAASPEEQAARAPYVEPGDCWTYRGESQRNVDSVGIYRHCVTFVDKAKDLIIGYKTVENNSREFDVTHTLDWGAITSRTGLLFTPPARIFRFPLRAGDEYPMDSEFKQARRGANAGRMTTKVKVIGWENVTVAAGTFRAMKVEGRGFYERYDTKTKGFLIVTYWYVPEVNNYVKFIREEPDYRSTEELVSFKLNN